MSCFNNLCTLYYSFKQTWLLSKIYDEQKLQGLKSFHDKHPQEFSDLLNQKIPNKKNTYWVKPGYLIARYGPQKFFEYIAKFIRDDQIHSNGYTLLHALVSTRVTEIREPRVKYLVQRLKVINVNVVDNYGRTCLFYLRGYSNLLNILINCGADVSLTDNDGLVAGEYRKNHKMYDYWREFDKLNALPLLKMAIRTNDYILAKSIFEYVDVSNWSTHERWRLGMLLASSCIYLDDAIVYLVEVLSLDILNDPVKLFEYFDQYFINVFGRCSKERLYFIMHGFTRFLLDRFDVRIISILKYNNLILQRKRFASWWTIYRGYQTFKDVHAQIPNKMEYAKRFVSLYPIKSNIHWYHLLNWLYVARLEGKCDKVYDNLIKKVISLRDVVKNNSMLHIFAQYDGMLEEHNPLLAHDDFHWIELCLQMGADVNAINNDGETPLFIALRTFISSWEDNKEFCRLLLKWGAHLDVVNNNGERGDELLKFVLQEEYPLSPFPLQCLAARICSKIKINIHLPKRIKHFIQLH